MNTRPPGNHASDNPSDMWNGISNLCNLREPLRVDMAETVATMGPSMLAKKQEDGSLRKPVPSGAYLWERSERVVIGGRMTEAMVRPIWQGIAC